MILEIHVVLLFIENNQMMYMYPLSVTPPHITKKTMSLPYSPSMENICHILQSGTGIALEKICVNHQFVLPD